MKDNKEETQDDISHLLKILGDYESDCEFKIVPKKDKTFVVLHNIRKPTELGKLEFYLRVNLKIENVLFQFSEYV